MVKLTVIHETAEPDSLVLSMVSGGWPQVLAALKTLLETGRAPVGVRRLTGPPNRATVGARLVPPAKLREGTSMRLTIAT